VIGQEPVIAVLKATIKRGQYASAYLFSGPSGTGKTTIGRIFAKAMLCDAPVEGNPCGKCESCQLFAKEQHYGYTEHDAASVGGKEDMVKLRDNASYSSVSKKRIILLDECHDISSAGQDSLLKQVEQCPDHLVYIFCTTDPEKVKSTLRTRCQAFQTGRVDIDRVASKLREICEAEGVSYDEDALVQIAGRSDGQVRNAVKILEGILYLGSVTTENLNVVVRDCEGEIFDILSNLGSDLPKVMEAYRKVSSFLSPTDLYTKLLDLTNDTCKFLYGYESFIPRRRQMVSTLKEIHNYNLLEFLNYFINRDKYVDRISLQSDLIVLHYKFSANSFVVQRPVVPVMHAPVLPVNEPKVEPTPEPASDPNNLSFEQMQSLPVKERSKYLREQHKKDRKTDVETDSSRVHEAWPLPKEERIGENSFEDDDVLTAEEFSQVIFGGRSFDL
jgi:DNA polymerase III subunit gamma/tau